MIYYPLSTLIIAGVTDVPHGNPGEDKLFNRLLGDGTHLGIDISYKIQEKPEGIAQALIIGKNLLIILVVYYLVTIFSTVLD